MFGSFCLQWLMLNSAVPFMAETVADQGKHGESCPKEQNYVHLMEFIFG